MAEFRFGPIKLQNNPFGNQYGQPVAQGQGIQEFEGGWLYDPNTGSYQNKTTGQTMTQQQYQKSLLDKQNLSKGINPDGSAVRPEWESQIDPATGKLKQQYQLDIASLKPENLAGYSAMKGEALRTGPSAWATMAQQKQGLEEQGLKAQAARQAMSAQNQALGGLAMRGGVSSGARASMARSGMRDLLGARQEASRQGVMNRLGIAQEDEANRIKQLGAFVGQEANLGTMQAKQEEANLQNLMREIEGKRAFEMGTYQEQMKKWAAGKQAEATARSGGGGGGKK